MPFRTSDDHTFEVSVSASDLLETASFSSDSTVSYDSDTAYESYLEPNDYTLSWQSQNDNVARMKAMLYTHLDKLFTKDFENMEHNSIESWFVDEALTEFTREHVGELFANGGFPAVRQALLEDMSAQISAIDSGSDIADFNTATAEWPHEARAYVSAYQYRFTDVGNEAFREQLEEFAEGVGVLEYEEMQTELDHFYGENPFSDDSLTREQAELVLFLRANDEDESIAGDIEDASNFIGWYKETGSVDIASKAENLDSDIPADVMGAIPPADQWEVLTPGDITTERCHRCDDTLYNVEITPGNPAYVDRHGTEREITPIGPGQPLQTIGRTVTEGIMCDRCFEEFKDRVPSVAALSEDNSCHKITATESSAANAYIYDHGLEGDSVFDSVEELSTADREKMIRATNDLPDGYFEIGSNVRAEAGLNEQAVLIREMANNPREILSDGPIMIRDQPAPNNPSILLRRDKPKVAREAKELLNNADELVAGVSA